MKTEKWFASQYLDTYEWGVISESGEIIVGVSSRLTMERAHQIAALPALLKAAKGVLPLVQRCYASDDRGPSDLCTLLENAIDRSEGRK